MKQRGAGVDDERWMIAVEGTVDDNEDPEKRHRIKVKIPIIDENLVFDKWVEQLVVYVGAPGYGSFFVPEKDTRVILFGRLGQKHNLYYMPVYDEKSQVPEDFSSVAMFGYRVPGDFKIICDGDLQLSAGGIHLEAKGAINITAPGGVFINDRRYD